MRLTHWLVGASCLWATPLSALTSGAAALLAEVDCARDEYYQASVQTVNPGALIESFTRLSRQSTALPESDPDRLYLKMRIDYLLATLYEKETSNPKDPRAREVLWPYHDYTKTFLAKEKASDHLRILADILLRTTAWMGLGGKMKAAGNAKALLEKALKIDGDNPNALLSRAQLYFFTPGIAGGSTSKAKELLTLSVVQAQIRRDAHALFNARLWITQIAIKQKDKAVYDREWSSLQASPYGESWLLLEVKALNDRGRILGD